MAEAWVGSGKVALFRQESPEGLTYRIPALMYLPPESTFLAFAEERSSPSDDHAKSLVMRRGKKEGASVQWGPQEALTTAILPGHRTMNPCPVQEKESGAVFLFFICVWGNVTGQQQIVTGRNAARLGYVLSQDGGRTWSQLTDLTNWVIGNDLENWATFAVGPGHGVQLHSGRLVIPAYAYYIHRRPADRPASNSTRPHCFTFYSDDGGRHWARGQLLTAFQTEECQVAELARRNESRVLYCNARSRDRYRVEALSTDGGERFEAPFLSRRLPETGSGCQGSVVSFAPALKPSKMGRRRKAAKGGPSTARHGAERWLIFSHPMRRDQRVHLAIFLNTSPLVNNRWRPPRVLHKGPSGYSDLAVCEEGQSPLFGCLFETGVATAYEEVAFQLFGLAGYLGKGGQN